MSTDRDPPSPLARVARGAGSMVRTSGIIVPLIILWIVLALTTPAFHLADQPEQPVGPVRGDRRPRDRHDGGHHLP